MGATTGIEWTEATPIVDRGGRRVRYYQRKRTDRPGTAERRRMRAQGLAWCSGDCQSWLPVDEVTKNGQCRPCVNARYRASYAADGAAIRAQKYARKRGLAIIPAWWRRDNLGGPCAYGCGRVATTLDHIWPVVRGGESRPGNLAPACGRCNSRKGDRHPARWFERGFLALPDLWSELVALALEHGTDEWLQTEEVAA